MPAGIIATADGFRAAHRELYGHIGDLAGGLDDGTARRETGCPGWSVRDCVAHISAVESLLIGREAPAHELPDGLTHVRSDFGRFMEMGVDLRRSWPLEQVVAEFREVTAERLAGLEGIDDGTLDEERPGVFSSSKLRGILSIRAFDMWSHEQDMRRALDHPGGLDGVAAPHSRERMIIGAAHRLQEALQPEAGTEVVFDITGEGGAVRAISFDGERGRAGDEIPASPAVAFRLDLTTLTVLACGRSGAAAARSHVAVEGDQNLGARVLEELAITP